MKETILIRGVEFVALAKCFGNQGHPQMVARLVRLTRVSDGKIVFDRTK